MTRRPSRAETRAANLAAALAAEAAARNSNTPAFGSAAHARFLAVGGAHVIITLDENDWYRVACEACGQLDNTGSANPALLAKPAQKHAETCRRMPERLWPKDGA